VTTRTAVPVDEYLSTTYRPDCDYVDGVLVERNVGERDHSELQMAIAAYLYARRREWGVHVFPEQRIQVKPTRFRVPDVCVVAGEKPRELVLSQPPLLCIEILSKDDRMSAMQERIGDYVAMGVRYVLVLDPRTKRDYCHTANGAFEIRGGVFRTENPEIVLPLSEIYTELESA